MCAHGLPSKYNLPFTVAEFTCLDSVPLISLDNGNAVIPENQDVESSTASDLRSLQDDKPDKAPELLTSTLDDPESALDLKSSGPEQTLNGLSETSLSNNNAISEAGEEPSPRSSDGSSTTTQRVFKSFKLTNGRRVETRSSTPRRNAPREVLPPPMDAHYSAVSSYMKPWENAPAENIYAPPVDDTPWGVTEATNWADPVNETAMMNNFENTEPSNHGLPNGSTWESGLDWSATNKQARDKRGRDNDSTKMTGAYWESRKTYQQPRSGGNGYPMLRASSDRPKTVWTGKAFDSQHKDDGTNGLLSSKYSLPGKNVNGSTSFPIKSDVAVNRLEQRIDLPLPVLTPSDQARFDLRIKSQKLCNEHQLRRSCRNEHCHFDHQPIDSGILLVLRHYSRRAPCSIGPTCRRPDCFYGHTCPYQRSGGCKNVKCAFNARGMHEVVDLEVAEVIPS